MCANSVQGPSVIYHQSLTSLTKEAKRASFRKGPERPVEGEKCTCLEFGVLTLEGDGIQDDAWFPKQPANCETQSSRVSPCSLERPTAEF